MFNFSLFVHISPPPSSGLFSFPSSAENMFGFLNDYFSAYYIIFKARGYTDRKANEFRFFVRQLLHHKQKGIKWVKKQINSSLREIVDLRARIPNADSL